MSRDNSYMIGNKFAAGMGPNQTSFKKGMRPWNKGKTGWTAAGTEATRFKKGMTPSNILPNGSITIRTDKNGVRRRWIKILGSWMMYSTFLWEKEKGPLPSGTFVHHIDEDTLHDAIVNYAVVTRRSHIGEHRIKLRFARMRDQAHPGKGFIRRRTAQAGMVLA